MPPTLLYRPPGCATPGLTLHTTLAFKLAYSRLRAFESGETRVRVNGQDVATLVVFGDEDVEPLLGAYTLEGLRLAADPVRQRLVSVPPRLM